jgi:Fe-S-cluster containining protein
MNSPEASSAAARLCAQCGLCCNGVMFHTVQLQPGDSARELAALGLKLKRKQGRHFILQPCPAFQNSQCSIYAARPERCGRFECQQLKRLAAGEITEAMASEKIHTTQRRVEQINELLQQAGKTNLKHPLSKRCEKALAEPVDLVSNQEAAAFRRQLTQAMQELNALLNDDFRIVPGVVSAAAETEAPEPTHLHV